MGTKKTGRLYRWEDRDADLTWERYNPAKPNEYKDYNDLINLWSGDRSIQKFIHFDDKIADSLEYLIRTDTDMIEGLFYAFDNDYLAGLVYITEPYGDFDETSIEYIIVNPRMKGQGIGTRMISSIKSNPTFFAEGHKGTFAATVEHTNDASKRVFIKNGFKMYKPIINEKLIQLGVFNVHNMNCKFGKWYFTERDNEMEKK